MKVFKIKDLQNLIINIECVCVTVGMEIDADYDSGSDGKLYRQFNLFFINKSTIIYHYIMFLMYNIKYV